MHADLKAIAVDFLVGGTAAAISKTMVAPLDRVKMILQTQDSNLQMEHGHMKRYRGILDVLRRIPRESGVLSYWRGNFTNIIRYFPTQAINFAAYNEFNIHLTVWLPRDTGDKALNYRNTVYRKLLAGGLAGAVGSAAVYPLTFCQTRIASDVGGSVRSDGAKIKRDFRTLRECIFKVLQTDGVKGIYRGFVMATVGVAFYRSVYFAIFDIGKELLIPIYGVMRNNKHICLPVHISFPLAQMSTIVSGMASYPLDTVSRRMMLQSGRPIKLQQYSSAWQCAFKLYREEGIYVFYRGGLSNCIRSFGGAIVLVLYDEIKEYVG